jgi:hypothetical protein
MNSEVQWSCHLYHHIPFKRNHIRRQHSRLETANSWLNISRNKKGEIHD